MEAETEARRGPLMFSLHSAFVCCHRFLCPFDEVTVAHVAQRLRVSVGYLSSAGSPLANEITKANVTGLLPLSPPTTDRGSGGTRLGPVYVLPSPRSASQGRCARFRL